MFTKINNHKKRRVQATKHLKEEQHSPSAQHLLPTRLHWTEASACSDGISFYSLAEMEKNGLCLEDVALETHFFFAS